MTERTGRACRLLLFAVCLFVLPAARAAVRAQAGPYRVELTTEPAVVSVGKARLVLKLRCEK